MKKYIAIFLALLLCVTMVTGEGWHRGLNGVNLSVLTVTDLTVTNISADSADLDVITQNGFTILGADSGDRVLATYDTFSVFIGEQTDLPNCVEITYDGQIYGQKIWSPYFKGDSNTDSGEVLVYDGYGIPTWDVGLIVPRKCSITAVGVSYKSNTPAGTVGVTVQYEALGETSWSDLFTDCAIAPSNYNEAKGVNYYARGTYVLEAGSMVGVKWCETDRAGLISNTPFVILEYTTEE